MFLTKTERRRKIVQENITLKKTAAKDLLSAFKETETGRRPVNIDNTVQIGDGSLCIIGGPCSVESETQIMQTAQFVKESGAKILRGGCFKPRTSPYDFSGLEEQGLKLLRKAGDRFEIPVVTEVMDTRDIELVMKYSDILQIGSRNAMNYSLLREIGRTNKPILLKRGLMMTIKEFIMSAEYILSEGNMNVVLCERGIRTFETETRNTLDISAIPVLKEKTNLPVIVDPSHSAGKRSLIKPLSLAAAAAGADGLMIECHISPESALCDGKQSLNREEFEDAVNSVSIISDAIHPVLY
ncbi:MAG: 3-deoxy-7-phosphoheptulonate synthase [Victivallales bacterium]|nr:3-deoxy-7-phosphoheptulonate synthase [Victivallales bacterium]